ncbi:MAG: PQQ-dependent sugar dehydrogenase [Pseudomonadota bacterium]
MNQSRRFLSCVPMCAAMVVALSSTPAVAKDATTRPCADKVDGLTLPEGFCASVFATGLGHARHIAVHDNGDVYVSLRGEDGGIVALRDTDGDGEADRDAKFGPRGGTGIGIRSGYLYFAMPTRIVRYALDGTRLVPRGRPEIVVDGFNRQRAHATKTIAFDDAGGLYTNIGAPSNACQDPQRTPGTPGQDPCPELAQHAGIWRYDADATDQNAFEDGERYATGIRNAVATAWHSQVDSLYVVQHGRDQLSELWPESFTTAQRVELPAEEFFDVGQGDDFGWPYCFYDPFQKKKVLAPEYGGDGKEIGRCASARDPLVGFPAHWAPNALLFYTGEQFPARYRGGAFVAFHGSWNRAPEPQRGYNVAFVPLDDGKVVADGDKPYTIFADGFAGSDVIPSPGSATYRPTGLAQTPDGALLVSDSRKGRIWRVSYNRTPAVSSGR